MKVMSTQSFDGCGKFIHFVSFSGWRQRNSNAEIVLLQLPEESSYETQFWQEIMANLGGWSFRGFCLLLWMDLSDEMMGWRCELWLYCLWGRVELQSASCTSRKHFDLPANDQVGSKIITLNAMKQQSNRQSHTLIKSPKDTLIFGLHSVWF